MTWQEALDLAVARNPSAAVAAQEIARAEGLVREARAAWLPTLSGNVHVHPPRSGAHVRAGAHGDHADQHLGRRRCSSTCRSSRRSPGPTAGTPTTTATIAIANAADVHRQIATAVGRTYLTVLLSHRRARGRRRARATTRARTTSTRTRAWRTGLGNGVDDARAEQELRTDEAQLKNAETALVRSQNALAVLLSEEDLVDAADDVTLAASAGSAVGDRPGPRASRTDVRAAAGAPHRDREPAPRRVGLLRADAAGAGAGVQGDRRRRCSPAAGGRRRWCCRSRSTTAALRYGIHKERKASDEEARVQLDASLRQVSVEVRSAFRVVENTDESLLAARAAAIAARTAATLADKSYRAGASTNIEVVDAERRARDADTQVALAEDAARQARLDLLLATGAFP